MSVFVLGAECSGSDTFARACRHLTNFRVRYRSDASPIGRSFRYPSRRIEVDPWLVWFLGRLGARYPDAVFVHLRRRRDDAVECLLQQWHKPWRQAFMGAMGHPIIGGIVIAWRGARGSRPPGAGFYTAMTCMMLGFFLSYIWYPFLPARGPWEHAEIMAGLRPFGGWLFTRAIDLIIAGAAVSGGCFPSAHVSGTWALTFGLYPSHPRAARWFALVATGLSIACVYTRYHHAADVIAGGTVAVVATAIGYWLTGASVLRQYLSRTNVWARQWPR